MFNTEDVWASVALVFYRSLTEQVLLIQRAAHPKDPWSGHLSFPGGKLEFGESPLDAALRECEEEIGLCLTRDHLLKSMPIGIAGGAQGLRKTVQPFVFLIKEKPLLKLNSQEVSQTFWVSVADFKNTENHTFRTNLSPLNPKQQFPGYPIDDLFLWGFSYETLKKALIA